MSTPFFCREKCGACCIVPSISSYIPGMPGGKPGGVTCIHLSPDMKCNIFEDPGRPRVCAGFMAEKLVCGNSRSEAARILSSLEGIQVELPDLK